MQGRGGTRARAGLPREGSPGRNQTEKGADNDSPPLEVDGDWAGDDAGADALLKDPWFGDGIGSLFQASDSLPRNLSPCAFGAA